MPPPANTTPATAIALTLPYDATLDVSDTAEPSHEVWWTYTAVVTDTVIGFWAEQDPQSAGDFDTFPRIEVWTDITTWPGTGTNYLDIGSAYNRPIQVPVETATTYWFRVFCDGGWSGSPTVAWHVNALRAPHLTVVPGSILINDDVEGFPLAIFAPTDGAVRRFVTGFTTGECAEILRGGRSLWQDAVADTTARLYDDTFTLVASPSLAFIGVTASNILQSITSNRVDLFYVGASASGSPPKGKFGAISAAGVPGATWTVDAAGLEGLAVTPDNLIAYYSNGSAILRWDLVADAALAPLAALVVGHTIGRDLIVLADGSIVAFYNQFGVAAFARRYNAAGAVLNTYPLDGTAYEIHRLTIDALDEATFWLWTHQLSDNGIGRFLHLRASDGVTLASFDLMQFREGVYHPQPTDPPLARFGHSDSCPFVTMPGDIPPPAYTLDERHIRRLRRAPHVNHENKRVFFRSFELDLERGQGLATGQGIDPIITLRLSRDGGQTWGEPMPLHAGRLGAYTQRVIARRLGVARDTVFEVTVSDPVAWSLVGAWLDLEPGTS